MRGVGSCPRSVNIFRGSAHPTGCSSISSGQGQCIEILLIPEVAPDTQMLVGYSSAWSEARRRFPPLDMIEDPFDAS